MSVELTPKEKRRQTMLEKYGGEAGLAKHYKDMQAMSRKNYSGTGGFAAMSSEKHREISSKGGKNGTRQVQTEV